MSFLDSIKHAGSKIVHAGGEAINDAKDVGSTVVHKAEEVGSNIVDGAERVGETVVHGAEVAEHAAVKAIKSEASIIRFELEKSFDNAKKVGSAVVDGAEKVGSDFVRGAEKVGSDFVKGAEKAEHVAVKTLKFEGRIVRFGLDKAYDGAKRVGSAILDGAEKVGTAIIDGAEKAGSAFIRAAAKGVNTVTHPGFSNPPAAQGLEFSETKNACDIAYKGNKGDIYKFHDGKKWQVVDVKDDPKTGFRAVALKPIDPNDKRVIVAYAGTSGSLTEPDWQTDIRQAGGLPTKQYNEAVDFANKWKAVAGDNVILTGHSLGGGLASYASIKTGLHATAINAAPLALNHLGLSPSAAKRVTQYYVPGEALSVENKRNYLDVRPGNQIPVRGKDSILDPRSIGSNHSLDHVAPDIRAPKKESKS